MEIEVASIPYAAGNGTTALINAHRFRAACRQRILLLRTLSISKCGACVGAALERMPDSGEIPLADPDARNG